MFRIENLNAIKTHVEYMENNLITKPIFDELLIADILLLPTTNERKIAYLQAYFVHGFASDSLYEIIKEDAETDAETDAIKRELINVLDNIFEDDISDSWSFEDVERYAKLFDRIADYTLVQKIASIVRNGKNRRDVETLLQLLYDKEKSNNEKYLMSYETMTDNGEIVWNYCIHTGNEIITTINVYNAYDEESVKFIGNKVIEITKENGLLVIINRMYDPYESYDVMVTKNDGMYNIRMTGKEIENYISTNHYSEDKDFYKGGGWCNDDGKEFIYISSFCK